jgi:hypothetical protein
VKDAFVKECQILDFGNRKNNESVEYQWYHEIRVFLNLMFYPQLEPLFFVNISHGSTCA